jgi:hypothetical protein
MKANGKDVGFDNCRAIAACVTRGVYARHADEQSGKAAAVKLEDSADWPERTPAPSP